MGDKTKISNGEEFRIYLEGMIAGAAFALICVSPLVIKQIRQYYQSTNSSSIISEYHPANGLANSYARTQIPKISETGLVEKLNGGNN